MLESKFQAHLIKRLEDIFPDCVIMKNDSGYRQGFPDLLVLYGIKWAVLEVKADSKSKLQPNQDYWIDRLGDMSFSAFIFPENENSVLEELHTFFTQ